MSAPVKKIKKTTIYFWIMYIPVMWCVLYSVEYVFDWFFKFLPKGLHWRWYRVYGLLCTLAMAGTAAFYWRMLLTLMVDDTTHIVTRKEPLEDSGDFPPNEEIKFGSN